MDSEESDIDVTELDDCLRELEAIDISDLELSENEQNVDAEKLPVQDAGATEEALNKPLETSKEKSFLPSCGERNAEFDLEGTAKINYPSHCTELGENYDIGKSNETEEPKPLAFQTDLSVSELRKILQTTIEKGILESKNKSEIPGEVSGTTTVVKDSVDLSGKTKTEETKQLISTLVQRISQLEPLTSPETTFVQKFSPVLESTPKTKCHRVREEDDSNHHDTAVKVATILKQEVLDPVPEGSEAVLSENESPAVLKRALSEASLSSCETVIFERRSPVNEQRLCRRPSSDVGDIEEDRRPSSDIVYIEEDRRASSDIGYIEEDRRPSSDIGYIEEARRPSSGDAYVEEDQRPASDIGDIEEVILVKSILQNLEALEACDDLEAISPDSMSSPPPIEILDKSVSAELSENDIGYTRDRRRKKRKKKRTKKRHDRKKKEDNEKDGVSDASSISSDDFLEHEKKSSRSLSYLAQCPSKMRSPTRKTHDRKSPSSSPDRSLPLPPPRKLKSQTSSKHSPHGREPLRYKPHDVHYARKSRRNGSSSSSSPSRSRSSYKKVRSAVKTTSAATSRSPTHSPPHRSLHSRFIKKRHDTLRSRSKSPKRHYRRRSRSRSFSPHSKKYSSITRRKYRKSSRNSESPSRPSPDVRSTSPLERKISRRLKKLESLRKASRRCSKSRSSSPKTKPYDSKERDSKSPKKSSETITSESLLPKNISEDVKKLSSPSSSVSRQISSSPVTQQPSTCPTDNSQTSAPVGKPETNSESLPKPLSPSSKTPEENTAVRRNQSPEKKVPPVVESRTPSPPAADIKTSKPEPMDISPTPETKLLKETTQPVLNADFAKLPPVPSLVMQLPPMWSQPPPPGTLPVCDTQTLPPPPGTLPFGVQQLPSVSTAQHPFPLQSQQQQQMHSSFGYSHPQIQGTYQSGSPSFGLATYSQNNNQNSFQQQLLYAQSSRPQIGCQNFTFPLVASSSSNLMGHSTQFQSTYVSSVTGQDMSVPPPTYNQSQKYQPTLITHNVVQYPPQTGNHTAPYVMQNAQQAHIMQNSQNVPQSQTQIKINVQQVLQPQNTNNQSLNRTSPFASCRDPRLKDVNISVSCETPISLSSVGTQLNTATISNQSNASPKQKVVTNPQMPLPGQPPLPPGQPPLPPGQPPPPPPGHPPPLPAGQPPLPPGPPPKEMKMEQPPLPKSPPPPSTPPFNKMSKVQDNLSASSTTQLQKLSTNVPHLQLNLNKLVAGKAEKNLELELMSSAPGSERSDSRREKPQEQRPECKTGVNECVCGRTGVEKKICLRCLYRKREKLEQASVFLKTPNLCRSVKRPIVVNLLSKRKTQPVTAIVKPNVHEIQTNSSSSEQSHQQESVTTTFNSNTLHSETTAHGSTELDPVLAEQRIDDQCGHILEDKNTVSVQKVSYPGPQANLTDGDTSSNSKNSAIITDVSVDQESVTHKQGNLVDGSEKIVLDDQTQNSEMEQITNKAVKKDEHTSDIKESLKDCVVLKQKDIDLNKVNSTSVQRNIESSFKNKYLTYVITGNKVNKTVLTSVISGNVENKSNSALRRSYRSKSADSTLDSLKQSAEENAKVPKDDLLHAVGNCTLMHDTEVLQNNTPCPMQNAEENGDKNNISVSSSVQKVYQEKLNSTEKPIHKYQISLSEKVEESDSMNSREASSEEKSKEIVVKSHIPNNDGNLDNARPKLNDIHLSEIKVECVSNRPKQDISLSTISVKEEPLENFEPAVYVKKEPMESAASDAERQSKLIDETFTKLISTGDGDLGSVCSSVEKIKCHETQKPSIELNCDLTAPVKGTEHSSSSNAVCSGEKIGNIDIQYKSIKIENSYSSISMQTDTQSLNVDTEPCTQDEIMGTATDSAPVIHENVFKRPINKDSSCAEVGEAITAVSDSRVIGNVQQPTTSLTQNNSEVKDNVAPNVTEDLKVSQPQHEKSVCHIGEVKEEKLFTKIPVECEQEKDNRIKISYVPERAVNISVSDSSDSDIIELPPTIDLCLSDDADDMHEVSVSQKVVPTVDVSNDKSIVLSDPECITIDSSPKKETSETNIENIAVAPSICSAPLIGSNETCISVTDSIRPAEVLDVTPSLNSNLCKLSIQKKDEPLLQKELEVSSDDSKLPSYPKRHEVVPPKPDISKSPPPSNSIITDTLLLKMKPAPRSVKLQQAAILQDKQVHDKLCDLNSVEGQSKSTQKTELDRQSAVKDTETKDTPSFSKKNLKGGNSKNKRNFSDVSAVLYADGRGEINTPPNIQQEYGEPSLKKRKQTPLVKNDEQTEPNQNVSVRNHPKHVQKSNLSVTVLQPISIFPSESREGTLSSQVQRYSSRILRSPQKNTVIFAKYMGSTNSNSEEEEDCSNEDTTTTQMERLFSKSEKAIKKYPHRSQLPSYAVSRRVLISRLRKCPVVLQANLKKMAKLLRQDSKLTQIPLVILEQIDLQLEQNKKIIQNLDLTRLTSRCSCCQVLCRSIATQTDSNHTK